MTSLVLTHWKIIALAAALVLLALLLKRMFWRGKKPPRYPYQRNGMLFTADDRAFFQTLKDAVGQEFEIFSKIRACDIIVPKKGLSSRTVEKAFSPIDDRHFDFILCEKYSLAVACVVQLHVLPHTVRQHEKEPLSVICENLGLPFVSFAIKADYSVEEVRDKLHQAITKEPFFLVETDGRKEPRISNIDNVKL